MRSLDVAVAGRSASPMRTLGRCVIAAAAAAIVTGRPSPGAAQVPLDVMTFNIRTSNLDDGDNAWLHRKELVAETIRRFEPHVIGMQEAISEQIEYLASALPEYRQAGHPPEELWWDTQVLREGYARSLDYSLQVMTEFAERFLDERTLLLVIGDHQAAPWVTGASGPNVPVHVIAHDSALTEPFIDWGFRPGAFPDPEGSPPRMDEFRDWFMRAFSGDASKRGASGVPPR